MPNTLKPVIENPSKSYVAGIEERGRPNLNKGKERAKEWISDQADYTEAAEGSIPISDITKRAEAQSSGDTLVKETAKAWIDPKALAQLIRSQTSGPVEEAQTRTGEEELLSPGIANVEPLQFVGEALKQVTEEMDQVHALAKSQGGKITPTVRKGFQRRAHRGHLVDVPDASSSINPEPNVVSYEGEGDRTNDSDLNRDQDDDYQSSVVESIRKDFSDFKEATQSLFWKIDKSLKQIDARLKALEGMPTPIREQGEVVSHRRVLSSDSSPHPVAVYTPTSGATSSNAHSVDTAFLLKTRHTLSPAVQHSILVKNVGASIANALKLPVIKSDWTPAGLDRLITNIKH